MLCLIEQREVADDISAIIKTMHDETPPAISRASEFLLYFDLFATKRHALPFEKIVESRTKRSIVLNESNFSGPEDIIGCDKFLLVGICALLDFIVIREMDTLPVRINSKH